MIGQDMTTSTCLKKINVISAIPACAIAVLCTLIIVCNLELARTEFWYMQTRREQHCEHNKLRKLGFLFQYSTE